LKAPPPEPVPGCGQGEGAKPHSWAIGQHALPSKPPACSCIGSAEGHASLSAVPG